MRGGEDRGVAEAAYNLACYHVYLADTVYLIAEKLYAQSGIGISGGGYLHHIAAHTEFVSREIYIVALILYAHKLCDKLVARDLHAGAQRYHHRLILLRVAEGVYAGYGSDNNHITPLGYCGGSGVAHFIYLIVYRRIFFYIHVLAGYIRLGLVIIIIADEILHGVIREKLAKLGAELRRKYLIVREDERRAVYSGDNVCHSKRLARACYAEQGLLFHAAVYALYQLIYRLRLVARGLIIRN